MKKNLNNRLTPYHLSSAYIVSQTERKVNSYTMLFRGVKSKKPL